MQDNIEVRRQLGDIGLIVRAADQPVTMLGPGRGERQQEIADVSADSEVANAADIDRDIHFELRLHGFGYRRALPLVERKTFDESLNTAAHGGGYGI